MRGQRNMAQMKEQNKTLEKELNKMETSNLLDGEFKTLVIRMLSELSENFNSIRKCQSEIKDTLIEMKNHLHGVNSGIDEAKNQSEIYNITKGKSTQSEQQEEKRIKKKMRTV